MFVFFILRSLIEVDLFFPFNIPSIVICLIWVYLPPLRWGAGEQRIHLVALAKHGYAKARRIGMMAMVGGKDKTRIRNATPIEFRDLLISIAESRIGFD